MPVFVQSVRLQQEMKCVDENLCDVLAWKEHIHYSGCFQLGTGLPGLIFAVVSFQELVQKANFPENWLVCGTTLSDVLLT